MAGVSPSKLNGETPYECPIAPKWDEGKEELIAHMELVTTQLGEIAQAIKDSNTNLIGPATGRRQVPLDVILVLIIFWGAYSIIGLVKDGHKNIQLNWTDGLKITENKDTIK